MRLNLCDSDVIIWHEKIFQIKVIAGMMVKTTGMLSDVLYKIMADTTVDTTDYSHSFY